MQRIARVYLDRQKKWKKNIGIVFICCQVQKCNRNEQVCSWILEKQRVHVRIEFFLAIFFGLKLFAFHYLWLFSVEYKLIAFIFLLYFKCLKIAIFNQNNFKLRLKCGSHIILSVSILLWKFITYIKRSVECLSLRFLWRVKL